VLHIFHAQHIEPPTKSQTAQVMICHRKDVTTFSTDNGGTAISFTALTN